MSYLETVLALFTPEADLEDDQIFEILRRSSETEYEALRSVLSSLFTDPQTDWIDLVHNPVRNAYEPVDQQDARQFVTDNIWKILFPREEPPKAGAR